jgi:hypothetical protein
MMIIKNQTNKKRCYGDHRHQQNDNEEENRAGARVTRAGRARRAGGVCARGQETVPLVCPQQGTLYEADTLT